MQATDTPTVTDRREELGERVAAAPGVLLCLDFDGTLAPIVEDPDEASITPEIRATLIRLVDRPSIDLAIVSGRQVDDVRERVAVDGARYAGNHGLELRRDGETVYPAGAEHRAAVERICDRLGDRLSDVPGCEIEDKGLTATVHYRRVPDERVDEVEEAVPAAVADAEEDLEIHEGKAVLEIRPPVDWDKGRVVERLADDAPDDWLPMYVGDDVTDEDAFEALADDGIAVLVGDRDGTAADYRVPSQGDVLDLLELIEERQTDGD